jgi:LAS superfamily LD-carboxypeptidase LdcB
MFKNADKSRKWAIGILLAITVIDLIGVGYWFYFLKQEINKNTTNLGEIVLNLKAENLALDDALKVEQERNNSFENKIGDIAGTVGVLDKLAKTDKELLQKYSKIYFLNENYVPDSVSKIPSEDVYETKKTEKIHSKVLPFLEAMFEVAKADETNLKIISAYRSFQEQASLKSNYTFVYGTGANKFSADQGYSEHQLGTTVDLTTVKLAAGYSSFGSDPAFEWMQANAYKYGFILSYPKDNSYYQSEPWHWRFVGKQLAKRLHEDDKYFYNLDQSTIDLYLVSLFDN